MLKRIIKMKAAVRLLCLFMVSMTCETYHLPEEIYELGVERPEGCEISASYYRYTHQMTCPDFSMEMEKHLFDSVEYTSLVTCSFNSMPYKYLPFIKSKRNKLTLEKCSVPGNGSFAEGWPELKFFEFVNFGEIEPLTQENFKGMDNVTHLTLFINTTRELPDDIFNSLPKLREIKLYVNQQTNKTIFNNLIGLEKIHFSIDSRESLDNFDTNELINLPALKTLELHYCPFTRLTKRFFEGCRNVENLELKFNKIDAIDTDAFEPLINLRNFKMALNTLMSLPEGIFSQNKKLEKIEIISNKNLTAIPSGLGSYLPNLRVMKINSKLTSIPNDLVRGSTELELLDLQFNELTSLPRDLLKNHSKLKRIKLHGTKIDNSTSADLFDNKSPLTEIEFDFDFLDLL